jgi:chaperone modulatory protein CbpM
MTGEQSKARNEEVLRGQLIGKETVISLEELCRHCTLERTEVLIMVEEGILDPWGEDRNVNQWQFHISSVRRVRTAVHLQRDLGVNLAGAALALELLDRIDRLK